MDFADKPDLAPPSHHPYNPSRRNLFRPSGLDAVSGVLQGLVQHVESNTCIIYNPVNKDEVI